MAKVCPHCGETSDRDNVCTWCNKSLVTEQKPAETRGPGHPGPASGGPADGRSRMSRPTRSEPPAAQPRPLWPYFVGAGVAVVVIVIVALFLSAKAAAGPPPEPADWKTMQSMTGLFSIEAPGNYKFSSSGSSASYEQITLKATKLCRVYVDGNGTKGAMSDVAAATSRMQEGPPTLATSAEGKFHVVQGELAKKRDPKYDETGEMGEWSFAGMPAAFSEYSTVKPVGLFAVKMKGWRISCMGGDFGYQVWAEAPEAQWEKFQPTARRILESAKMAAQK